MDIRYSGKNLTVTPGMREHFQGKLERLEKYAPRLVESHVVLKKEKYIYEAEVTLLAKNLKAYGDGRSKENIFTAIDQAYTRIEKQLKKFREKIKDHHKKNIKLDLSPKGKGGAKWANAVSLAVQRPRIVRSDAFAPKPMSIEEASLQLELLPESFLVFMNASTERVNVIFKREDGNHGLVESKF